MRDAKRHGWPVVNLRRCPGCRRPLDPETMEELADGIAEVAFYACRSCWERSESDPAFMDKIIVVVADWLSMDAELARYRGTHADVQ